MKKREQKREAVTDSEAAEIWRALKRKALAGDAGAAVAVLALRPLYSKPLSIHAQPARLA